MSFRFCLHRLETLMPVWSGFFAGIVLLVSFSVGGVSAAENNRLSLRNLYGEYENSQFVLKVPLTQSYAQHIKQRKHLYRFQIFYFPGDQALGSNGYVRIGFFRSEVAAREFIRSNKLIENNFIVERLPKNDYEGIFQKMGSEASQNKGRQKFYIFSPDPRQFKSDTERALNYAKTLYLEGKYKQAQQIYLLLNIFADDHIAAWAAELNGLCFEKLGDRKSAIASYQNRLLDFPDESGQARIEQRLRALETASSDGTELLRTTKDGNNSEKRFFFRGMLGQYQRSMSRSVNGGDSEEVLSSLSTDFDFRASGRWDKHDLNFRTNGYWIKDSLNSENNELRLKHTYIDYSHRRTGIGVTLGRQREYDSGAFTSFDGLTASYPVRENLTVSIAAGVPQYISEVYDNLDYQFYSTYLNWDINNNWQLNTYLNLQELNGVTDREALGIRGRYTDNKLSAALNIDYDIAFSELNSLVMSGNYRFESGSGLSVNYGSQRSPFLTATNILIGQVELDLELYLQSRENRESLLDDALARTSLNDYFSFSYNKKLNKQADFIIDFYQSKLSEIPPQDFLTGIIDTVNSTDSFQQQSWGARLVAQRAFYGNDIASIGIRQTSGDTSDSFIIFLSEKLRLANKFFIYPKLNYSRVDIATNNISQNQFRYSLLLTYKPTRNSEVNFEAGNESISWEGSSNTFDSTYLFFGYRVNFY